MAQVWPLRSSGRYSNFMKVSRGHNAVTPQSEVSLLARSVFTERTRPQWSTCWVGYLEWEEGGSVLEVPRKIIRLVLNNTKAEKGGGFPDISRYRLQVWLASYLYQSGHDIINDMLMAPYLQSI